MANEQEQKPKLPLVVDGKAYEWPHQYITGEEIIRLAGIPPTSELFLKITPPWEDEIVHPETRVDLARPGIEHFYSRERQVSLIVNGREKPWRDREISFDQVIILAFGNIANTPNTAFTVTYKGGPERNKEGMMVQGDNVWVKNKMIFNVTATDKS